MDEKSIILANIKRYRALLQTEHDDDRRSMIRKIARRRRDQVGETASSVELAREPRRDQALKRGTTPVLPNFLTTSQRKLASADPHQRAENSPVARLDDFARDQGRANK